MVETLEYIEDYFAQALTPEERKAFEARCVQDEAFAREVAFYLTARNETHELLAAKKQNAAEAGKATAAVVIKPAPVRKMNLRKWLPYAAAACVIFAIGFYFLYAPPKLEQLANSYIKGNYTTLGKTMDGSRDSMQLGIDAYNNRNYTQAQNLFDGVRKSRPDISDAKKFAGLAYLQTKNYDKALQCFEELAAMDLNYNSGDLLQAVTLMQRNNTGDKEKAKALLQKVVQQNEQGSEQAADWLKQLE